MSDYIDNFTKEEIKEKIMKGGSTIEDTLDLSIVFTMHNIYPQQFETIYEDRIELTNFNFYDEDLGHERDLRYFSEGNKIEIFIPVLSGKTSFLHVKLERNDAIDEDDIDELVELLSDVLPETIYIDNIIFTLDGDTYLILELEE